MTQPVLMYLEQLLNKIEGVRKNLATSYPDKQLINNADEDYRTVPMKKRLTMDALGNILLRVKEDNFLVAKQQVPRAKTELHELRKFMQQYSASSDYRQAITTEGSGRDFQDQATGQAPLQHASACSTGDREPATMPSQSAKGTDTEDQIAGRRHHDQEKKQMVRQNSKKLNQAFRRNNPEIADLSDENRPTKIAERYSELYDNQWTDAFDALTSNEHFTEKQAINLLRDILENAYTFNQKEAELFLEQLGSGLMKTITAGVYDAHQDQMPCHETDADLSEENRYNIVQLRKEHASKILPGLQQKFIKSDPYKKTLKSSTTRNSLDIYANIAVDITWWMNVQDPPVVMDLSRDKVNQDFNPAVYRAFMKSGKKVEFYVWPALFLYKPKEGRGPLMAKGVAQGC